MAAAAIVSLISTGPAELGMSEASSVMGPLLLQLCPSSQVCVASREQRLGAVLLPPARPQAALAPSGAFPEGPGVVLSSAGPALGEPRKLWG